MTKAKDLTGANAIEQLTIDFFAGMGPDIDVETFKDTYRKHLSDDVVWESVGFDHHDGLDDCLAYIDTLHKTTGMSYCEIDIKNLASAGNVVLSERVDKMFRSDGSVILDFRLASAIEVKDGKIVRYTDYLDTLGTAKALESLAAEMGHTQVPDA
jgi:limonene-1,2-epoxide hydrolase